MYILYVQSRVGNDIDIERYFEFGGIRKLARYFIE